MIDIKFSFQLVAPTTREAYQVAFETSTGIVLQSKVTPVFFYTLLLPQHRRHRLVLSSAIFVKEQSLGRNIASDPTPSRLSSVTSTSNGLRVYDQLVGSKQQVGFSKCYPDKSRSTGQYVVQARWQPR